jgi:hypothetical protein
LSLTNARAAGSDARPREPMRDLATLRRAKADASVTRMSGRLVEQRQVETRSVNGVEQPVFDELRFDGRDWIVFRGVCDQGRSHSETYRTEAEARGAFASVKVTLSLTRDQLISWQHAAAAERRTLEDWMLEAAALAYARGSSH